MLKNLFKKKKLKKASEAVSPAATAAWEEYAKEKLFDDPSEMLQAKWAFNAGFEAAKALYKGK